MEDAEDDCLIPAGVLDVLGFGEGVVAGDIFLTSVFFKGRVSVTWLRVSLVARLGLSEGDGDPGGVSPSASMTLSLTLSWILSW